MTIDKVIKVELTEQEYSILTQCEEVIDKFIEQMEELNLKGYYTEYDHFDEDSLDELAKNIHSLRTVYEADQEVLKMDEFTTYTAHAIIDILGTEIEMEIPYLENKCECSDLREIILEHINESLYIKSFDYTEDED